MKSKTPPQPGSDPGMFVGPVFCPRRMVGGVETMPTAKLVPFISLRAQYSRIRQEVVPKMEQMREHARYVLGPEAARFGQASLLLLVSIMSSAWAMGRMPCFLR
jgi:hypothetical protein